MHIANGELNQTAFVGYDIIDIEVMGKVVLRIAPSDAHQLGL
jgi:3-deoxy-D-manno-octulosonate 8-phosphate phosphatase KdsC-like HAD superfamily phosphatase